MHLSSFLVLLKNDFYMGKRVRLVSLSMRHSQQEQQRLRAIYKELEFDLGKNCNLGWIITARFRIKDGLEAILEKKTNLRYYELDYGKEIEEATDKILKYCQRIAQEVLKELTGGISLGALRWYEAFGHPESITILESNGKEIKKRQEISFK